MPSLGHITPSNFDKILTFAQYKKILKNPEAISELSVTAQKYGISVARGIMGVKDKELNARALDHGNTWEPVAKEAYEMETFQFITPVPEPIFHPELTYVCGKPDGLIRHDGLVEIKCPENPDNHFLNMLQGEQLEDYYAQIQGYMLVTGREWCDFVSFHPDYPKPEMLHIIKVERNAVYIDILTQKIIQLRKWIIEKLSEVSPRFLAELPEFKK